MACRMEKTETNGEVILVIGIGLTPAGFCHTGFYHVLDGEQRVLDAVGYPL
jgi:hypothetical protein